MGPSALKQEGPRPSCSRFPWVLPSCCREVCRALPSSSALPAPWRDMVWPSGSPQLAPDQRADWCPGSVSFCQTPALGRGRGSYLPPGLQLFSLSVLKHSWHCSLWSLSEPVCFPSASSSRASPLRILCLVPGGSQQLGRGSLSLWGPAIGAGAEAWSSRCCPVQTGYTKGLQALVGYYASGLLTLSKCLGTSQSINQEGSSDQTDELRNVCLSFHSGPDLEKEQQSPGSRELYRWQPVQGLFHDAALGSLCWLLQMVTSSIAVATS